MILALVMGAGVALLLVAPRVHRRSTRRASEEANRRRNDRARDLGAAAGSSSYELSATEAERVRRALLLRGVRAEVLQGSGDRVTLVVAVGHARDVEDLLSPPHPE